MKGRNHELKLFFCFLLLLGPAVFKHEIDHQRIKVLLFPSRTLKDIGEDTPSRS